jgi:hypothetical protein
MEQFTRWWRRDLHEREAGVDDSVRGLGIEIRLR